MINSDLADEYRYESGDASHTSAYLWSKVERILRTQQKLVSKNGESRVFDLGCGNGAFTRRLKQLDIRACGVDLSSSGVAFARATCPEIQVEEGSVYDDLAEKYGQFPAVVSLEVVEHLYYPRVFAKSLFDLVEPGGIAIVSTPYHGYFKNLSLALSGKLDSHFTVLWEHGHIKFWSVKTLRILLMEAGFRDVKFEFAGRIPLLAKSMIAIANRP